MLETINIDVQALVGDARLQPLLLIYIPHSGFVGSDRIEIVLLIGNQQIVREYRIAVQ